jgi:hypothetical protein
MNEPNLKMNQSDELLANQELNFITSSTEAVTSNNMM